MPVVLRESGVEELSAFLSQLKTVIKKQGKMGDYNQRFVTFQS